MAGRILNILIAFIWIFSGLYCKLLNRVPRHHDIVARILGEDIAGWATPTIGVLEILMGLWVLSRIQKRFCAISQIILVATMNTLEFLLAPDLLLFGRTNAILACVLIGAIYINGFRLTNKY